MPVQAWTEPKPHQNPGASLIRLAPAPKTYKNIKKHKKNTKTKTQKHNDTQLQEHNKTQLIKMISLSHAKPNNNIKFTKNSKNLIWGAPGWPLPKPLSPLDVHQTLAG